MIHDKICESRKVNSVSFYAEALWVRLITKADDNGNYYRDAFRIHANCMLEKDKGSQAETEKAIKELLKVGLLQIYEADNRQYVHITDFHEYQELRGDRNAQIDHPVHPAEMGGAYISEGLRRDTWASKDGRDRKSTGTPSGDQEVPLRFPKPEPRREPTGTPEVQIKDQVSSNTNTNGDHDERVPEEPQNHEPGNWAAFCEFFRKAAGGTNDFTRFESNRDAYYALCRRHGSDAVDSVVREWVGIKGGKKATKKNAFACKNFLADADGLIEDRKEGDTAEPVTEEVAKVAGYRPPQGEW